MAHRTTLSTAARLVVALTLCWLAVPVGAAAQDRTDASATRDAWPAFDVSLRGGVASLAGGGDLFEMMRRELTFGSSDLRAPAWGVETSARIMDGLHLLGGWEAGTWNATTHAREPLPDGDATQRFSLDLDLSVYAGLRLHLTGIDRADTDGRIPDVFLTAGAGWKRVHLRQEGGFPDRRNRSVFPATFAGEGETAWAFGGVGVRVPLAAGAFLVGELRYQGGAAEVGGDFHDFGPVDLSGVGLTLGAGWGW